MTFKIYNCDIGIKVRGTVYNFTHVRSVEIEDPERNRKTRGANAGDDVGINYRDGLTDPKRWTIPILKLTPELKVLLDEVYTDQIEVDVFCIDRKDGSSKWARNSILSNRPQQLTLDETAESMDVSLEFETFASTEVHKS